MLLKDTGRWNRLKSIFERAAEIADPILVDAFLKAECGGDLELLEEARRLVELHHEDGLALDGSPVAGMTNFGQILGGRVWEAGQLLAGARFRIVRFLGEGGVGEVYEAEDLELKQPLAIKTLHPLRASEESTRERFKREIQLARRISHPHVCRIFDFYPGEIPFITMELLEGEVLSDRIKREGHLSGDDALPIARELCSGLAAAHAQNIVHRDLKPSNIMLCDGRAVIMDFGLALLDERHDADGATAPTSAMGTPAYMSPEQLEGRRVTPASDIYSLGVVLYAMLTGTTPHAGLSPLAIAARRVQEPPPSPRAVNPDVSERWDEAVRGCLNVDPAKRIGSADAIVEAIEGGVKKRWRVPLWMVGLVVLTGLGWWLVSGGLFAHQPTAEAQRWMRMGDDAMTLESSYAASRIYAKASEADPKFALARIRLAEAEMQQDRYERAKDHLLEADLVLGRAPSTVVTELQAAKAASVRDFPMAVRLYKELVQTAADRPGALLTLSGIQARSGDRKGALASVEEATKLNPQLAAGWLRRGALEDRPASESFKRAEELFDLQGNKEGLIEVYRSRALATGRPLDEAKAELEKALRIARSIQSPSGQAQVLFAMSRINALRGDGDQAIAQATEARGVANAAQLDELSIRGILELAQAKASQYRTQEIEPMLRDAARQAESLRAFFLLARVRHALAKALSLLPGRAVEIDLLLDQAEGFYRANNLMKDAYDVVSTSVIIDAAGAHYEAARNKIEEAIGWLQRSGNSLNALIAEEDLAEIDDRTGALNLSLPRYQHLADAYDQLGMRQKAVYALANGASAAVHWGDLAEAHKRIARAHEILKKMNQSKPSSGLFLNLVEAELALAETRYADAEHLSRLLLEGNKGGAILRDLLANGILAVCMAATGRTAAGLQLAESNLEPARAEGQQYIIGQTRLRQLETLMHARRFDEAARTADELIAWLDGRHHRAEQIEALALRAAARRQPLPDFPAVWSKPELTRFLARPNLQQLLKGRITQ